MDLLWFVCSDADSDGTVAVAADILDSRRSRAGMHGKGAANQREGDKGAATRLLYWRAREGGKREGIRHLSSEAQRAENNDQLYGGAGNHLLYWRASNIQEGRKGAGNY